MGWFYWGSYIRFASSDFNMADLDNEFVHLCNNSIQKCSEHFGDAEFGMEGWMWTGEQFVDHLRKEGGEEEAAIWQDRIVPSMKEQAVAALQCACGGERDTVEGRSGSFEMYGYDFMVD